MVHVKIPVTIAHSDQFRSGAAYASKANGNAPQGRSSVSPMQSQEGQVQRLPPLRSLFRVEPKCLRGQCSSSNRLAFPLAVVVSEDNFPAAFQAEVSASLCTNPAVGYDYSTPSLDWMTTTLPSGVESAPTTPAICPDMREDDGEWAWMAAAGPGKEDPFRGDWQFWVAGETVPP